MKTIILLSALFFSGLSASAQSPFAKAISEAHHRSEWYAKGAVETGIRLGMGEKVRFSGKLDMLTHGGMTKLTVDGGTTLGFDQEGAWIAPAESDFEKPRFHSLTWSYFLAAPFKLEDPGAKIEPTGKKMLNGKEYETAKLTFDPGTGDAPDDWYLLYQDSETGRLAAMAYVVTYKGMAKPKDKEEPHAITYEDYQSVDGVPVPMHWKFWNWSENGGLGDQLMEMKLSDFKFVSPKEIDLTAPSSARRLPEL